MKSHMELGKWSIAFLLGGQTLFGKDTNTVNRLEQAVRAKDKIHEVNKSAAKPGERPHAYGSPGRERHGKGEPPGRSKKP